jgi:hypothetical protein
VAYRALKNEVDLELDLTSTESLPDETPK